MKPTCYNTITNKKGKQKEKRKEEMNQRKCIQEVQSNAEVRNLIQRIRRENMAEHKNEKEKPQKSKRNIHRIGFKVREP